MSGVTRPALLGPWLAVSLALGTSWLLPADSDAFILAVVIAIFVVPHGALDVLSLRGPAAFAAYLSVLAVALLGWWVAPTWSLALFFVVTAIHFAQGDAAFLPDGRDKLLRSVPRGVLPLALPGVFHPQEYEAAIALVLASLRGAPADAAAYVVPVSWVATAICFGVILCFWRRRTTTQEGSDLAALLLLFLVAPPMLAIGLYLALWHGWRHLLRVSALRAGTYSSDGVIEAIRSSAPTIAVSVLGFVVLIGVLVGSQVPTSFVLGPTLALLASLTLPHVFVVTALDHGLMNAGTPDNHRSR